MYTMHSSPSSAHAAADGDGEGQTVTGRFEGYERGASVLRFACADGSTARLATSMVWDVRDE